MLSRKKIVFMETNNISKKNFKSQEISKISHKILAQLKYCRKIMLFRSVSVLYDGANSVFLCKK